MLKKIKNIKPIDIVYISILFFIIIIVIILFFVAAKSITLNINKIFTQQENNNIQLLDREKYNLLEKKLNINQVDVTKANEKDLLNDNYISNNNKLISIKIINATSNNGVAKKLSQELISLGFINSSTTETSNQQLPNTTIAIKENIPEYKEELKKIISKTYPNVFITTNDLDSKFDVIITIGFKQ